VFSCVTITPFGLPVDPEVNIIYAKSDPQIFSTIGFLFDLLITSCLEKSNFFFFFLSKINIFVIFFFYIFEILE